MISPGLRNVWPAGLLAHVHCTAMHMPHSAVLYARMKHFDIRRVNNFAILSVACLTVLFSNKIVITGEDQFRLVKEQWKNAG